MAELPNRSDDEFVYTEEKIAGGLHVGPVEITDEMVEEAWSELLGVVPSHIPSAQVKEWAQVAVVAALSTQQESVCSACGGSGAHPHEPGYLPEGPRCPACGGSGRATSTQQATEEDQ